MQTSRKKLTDSIASADTAEIGGSLKRGGRSLIIFLLFGLAVTFVALPLAALFAHVTVLGFVSALSTDMVVEALKLSFLTSGISLLVVIVFGTPLAYINARHQYGGKSLIEALITLPIVLPPAVAGLALLMAFGRRGLVGQYFSIWGIDIAFTTVAVILAQIFVSSPFYIRQATTSFEDVDPVYERAAHTLGASSAHTFFRVTIPIALNGLISGAIMTWARALGEFGATVLFAGNLEGKTQTMPLAIYSAMQGDVEAAIYIAVILVLISFAVIVAVRWLSWGRAGSRTQA
ncbi:MAG: ABC transporter permease [Halobacteriota archaeon]